MSTKGPETADGYRLSELRSSSDTVQVGQKSYEMPPRDGFTITLFITVADINRSADFYEKIFGGRVLSRGDCKGRVRTHSDREYVAHCERRGRPYTGQADGNAERPLRPGQNQQLYEYSRCGYSSLL
jgi:Glyoxalase/Bleomycin resistance protein/Dioxygenase superfamily